MYVFAPIALYKITNPSQKTTHNYKYNHKIQIQKKNQSDATTNTNTPTFKYHIISGSDQTHNQTNKNI